MVEAESTHSIPKTLSIRGKNGTGNGTLALESGAVGPCSCCIKHNRSRSKVQVNQWGRGAGSKKNGTTSPGLSVTVRGTPVNDNRALLQKIIVKKGDSSSAPGSS